MPPKWIGFIIFVWVISAIAGSFSVGESLIGNSTISSPVQDLMYCAETMTNTDAGIVSMASALPGFFTAILRILFLDFPVFHEGPWVILRWIILAPLIGTIVYGIVATFSGILQRQV